MKRTVFILAALPLLGCDQAMVTGGGKTNMPVVVESVADVVTHRSQINAAQQAADKLKSIQADQQKQLKAAEEMGP